MENCIKVGSDNILAVYQAVYNDKGKLCKIYNEIYGFINAINNRITLLNINTKQLLEEEYILDYIGEHVICMHDISINLDYESIILKRSNFELLYRSNKSIIQVGDIIYEQGEIMLHDNGGNKKIFNLEGKQIGTIVSGSQLTIKLSDADGLYICESKIGVEPRTTFFRYKDGDEKIEILDTLDDCTVKEIGFGLLLFNGVGESRESFVYDIINNEKF